MNQRGHTLIEIVFSLAILLILAAGAAPHVRAYAVRAHLIGAGEVFKSEFLRARSIAARAGTHVAIRFEGSTETGFWYSTYVDGNRNGVLSADIARGIDRRISGPNPVGAGYPDVRVAILPGMPAIPPEHGTLDPTDPVRFGRSNMISFSPMGTATPGTFYLAGRSLQAAVRINGLTSRVRLLLFHGRWIEQ